MSRLAFRRGSQGSPSLERKLSWVTFVRLLTVSVLLGGTAVVAGREGPDSVPRLAPLFVLAGGVYAATAVFAFALRARRDSVRIAYAQIVVDAAMATVVVALTGRAESLFLFMYSLAVVNGAILLFRRGASFAGVLSIAGYVLVNARALGAPPVAPATLFTHSAAFAAIALLAGYLAEQLRATGEQLRVTGERLERRESDLAALATLHGTVVQSMTAGLVTLDAARRVTFLNAAGEQLAGVRFDQARGRSADEVLPAFDPGGGRGEVEHARAGGERILLGYTAFPLVSPDGGVGGSAVIFQDLTRLREMEEAVQRSARLADLGRVAAGLAHELRNPLASMCGSVELLREHAAGAPEDRRLMEIVLREAGRLDELVTQFLAFARPAPPRCAATDVAAVLDETLRVFRNDPQASAVRVEADLAPAVAECDPDQIRQVVWNLLSNAAQALGGAARPEPHIRVSCASGPAGVRIEVEDDGPGIAPADLEKIFLPFFTTKSRGTGLGLATVHRIVDAHRGSIRVASAPGAGCRFTVDLPPAGCRG